MVASMAIRSPGLRISSPSAPRFVDPSRYRPASLSPAWFSSFTEPSFFPAKRDSADTVSSVRKKTLPSSSIRSAALIRAGSRNRARRSMVAVPTTAATIPTGAISKIEKAGRPCSRATPSTSRLVEVPISVHVPPRIAAYDKGIRSCVGAMPILRASRTAIGMSTTTTGVLFIKAEAAMVPMKNRRSTVLGRSLALEVSQVAAASSVPVRTKAPDRTNMAAMVMGALFEKTPITSLVLIRPSTRKAAAPAMATTEGGNRSSRNATKVAARITRAMAA